MPANAKTAAVGHEPRPTRLNRNEKVLVLHPDNTPTLTSLPRAITLVYCKGEAILLEKNGVVHASQVLDRPTVIQLEHLVERYSGKLGLTHSRIFERDGYRCQYCGATGVELTIDHVFPKARGGQRTWDNLVSACFECNQKKADRTPEEAGMQLLSVPKEPDDPIMFQILMEAGDDVREVWRQYLEQSSRTADEDQEGNGGQETAPSASVDEDSAAEKPGA